MELRLLVWLGAEPGALGLGLTLALTYLAHSLLWAAAVLVLARKRAVSSALRHLCWKVALFAPILTTLVAARVSEVSRSALAQRELNVPALLAPASPPTVAASSMHGASIAPTSAVLGGHGRVLVGAALGAAAFGLLRFVASALVLRGRLRGRRCSSDARLRRRFESLQRRMGLGEIRLTESSGVVSPLVIGLHEVCIPPALLNELADSEVDSVLAHELAHIERRDGVWFPLVGAVQSMLWLQPLNHWISSRIRETAELACDDRAVEVTGNPLGLARVLVRFATNASLRRGFSLVPTMARSKSALMPRLKRLTTDRTACVEGASNRNQRSWIFVTVAVLASAFAFLRVHVAEAVPHARTAPVTVVASTPKATHAEPSPSAAEYGERLAELARREHEVTRELEAAQQAPGAQREGSPEFVRVLELGQEQQHLREMQAWLEERFVAE